jgi:hypothetical protein
MLRKILGPKGREKLSKEKLYNMHSSNIIRVTKSSRMRRARRVDLIGRTEIHKEF